jgi:hypothetical protein
MKIPKCVTIKQQPPLSEKISMTGDIIYCKIEDIYHFGIVTKWKLEDESLVMFGEVIDNYELQEDKCDCATVNLEGTYGMEKIIQAHWNDNKYCEKNPFSTNNHHTSLECDEYSALPRNPVSVKVALNSGYMQIPFLCQWSLLTLLTLVIPILITDFSFYEWNTDICI